MKRYIYFGILLFIISLIIGYVYGQRIFSGTALVEEDVKQNDNKIIDVQDNVVSTISKEIRVLPTTYLGIKKKYKGCNHTSFEFVELPKELINKNEEEVSKAYPDWEIEEFYENKIILYKEEEGICDEHFFVELGEEYIEIYRLLDLDGKKVLYERTNIGKEYLPDEDIKKLENGMYIYGKDNINSIIEDFE